MQMWKTGIEPLTYWLVDDIPPSPTATAAPHVESAAKKRHIQLSLGYLPTTLSCFSISTLEHDTTVMCTHVPKDFHVGGSGGFPDKLEPSKVEVLHTVRQTIPLSKAIDRANIKETPSPVPLSPQYVKAHPLDLQTPDPLLTPVLESSVQRAKCTLL
ncbi:unnamed protein product [Pleuronectes platessa]|uniref:Uncharacterized protein n=1 Tax=Pleuronectes platessa TaxID=8262 RepID=A0A9N7YCB4_PLEPL|nr:unnamed protein product [Pleuronectes platessa]